MFVHGHYGEEARAILTASLNYRPRGASSARSGRREMPQTAAAKRWVPWLCAYTGARVGEMVQLRKQDLRQVGELWVLRITPEAGTVKSEASATHHTEGVPVPQACQGR